MRLACDGRERGGPTTRHMLTPRPRPAPARPALPRAGESATALNCSVSRAALPLRLEAVLQQLQRCVRLRQQLEGAWLRHNSMLAVRAQPSHGPEPPHLVLQFLNAGSATRVALAMPWPHALGCAVRVPSLSVAISSHAPEEDREQHGQALHAAVLSRIAPGASYLPALCFAMCATLESVAHAPGEAGPSGAAGVEGATAGQPAVECTPVGRRHGGATARMFENPLYTAAVEA